MSQSHSKFICLSMLVLHIPFTDYTTLETVLEYSGIGDNETIMVYGSGGADPEGNQPGDLYVTIKVIFSQFFHYLYVGDNYFVVSLGFFFLKLILYFCCRSGRILFSEEKAPISMWMLL